MNGYTNIDVLKVFQKTSPLGLDELRKKFPGPHGSYNHLLECYHSLLSNEFIKKSVSGKWEISQKGINELRRLEEERDISKKMNLLQIQTLETELPLIKKKLKDYNLYKWISIISGIVSIVSVCVLLSSLLSHK